MDAATAERINNLAKNLKDLHLASSMDEAFEKARQIILEADGGGKTIKSMYEEEGLLKETQSVAKTEEQEIQEVSKVVDALHEFKEAQTQDEESSLELTQETAKVATQLEKEQGELARIKAEIEQAKRTLDEAKKVSDGLQRQIPSMQDIVKNERKTLSEEEKKKSDLSKIFNFGRR